VTAVFRIRSRTSARLTPPLGGVLRPRSGVAWESARNKMFALDFASQAQEMKAIGGQPDYALGSVHAVTWDGTLVIASASGSQLASYAVLAWLVRPDDRMPGHAEMRGRVPPRRVVTASNMTAFLADTQMHPVPASLG
jgi:hypothetical protein